MNKRIKLDEKHVDKLVMLPETGMGYQLVSVILKDGRLIERLFVFNSEILELKDGADFESDDISDIFLYNLNN